MTDAPKAKWGFNSILNDVAKEQADDKAKNAAVKADPNAGAPAADAPVDPKKAAKAIAELAKKDPNPMAKPEDPTTDPMAAAKAANDMERATSDASDKNDAAAAASKKAKAALAQVHGDDATEAIVATHIDSVKGPPGAPIGYGVHKLSVEGGNPYAQAQNLRDGEPVRGIQHQPVMVPEGTVQQAPKVELSPEMQYRRDVGESGVRAADASYKDLVAAGMTDTPKVRFNNSILAPAAYATADAKAGAAPAAPA
jgi:hypothetical protein